MVALGANAIVSQNNSIVLGASNVNVAIGNTAPQNKLEITKGVANQSGLRFTNLNSSSPASVLTQAKFLTVNSTGDVILGSLNNTARASTDLDFWQKHGDNIQSENTAAVVIGNSIDSTPLGYKLYVEEGILTEKVKVAVKNTKDWSDYVFNSDYALAPLAKVEEYIKHNKHLPGIPSAREMVKNGNDLHKTDAKLLKKLEELTLYSIQLNKLNNEQKSINDRQQREINELKRLMKLSRQNR